MKRIFAAFLIFILPSAMFSQSQVRTEASNNKAEYFALAGTDTISSVRGEATLGEVRYIERIIFSQLVASDTTLIVAGTDTLVSVIQTSDLKPYAIEVGAIVRTNYALCIRKKASKLTIVWRERY